MTEVYGLTYARIWNVIAAVVSVLMPNQKAKSFDLEPPRAVTSEDVEPAKGWNAMTDRAVYTDGRAIDQVASGGDGRLSAVYLEVHG